MNGIRTVLAAFLILLSPAVARAGDPADEPPTDELSDKAVKHVLRASELARSGAYAEAEAEFVRAAFFSPRWRPLHFNLGVLAEAQGKLGVAIREYETFKAYATEEEALLVEQRIHELGDRRKKFIRSQRGQMTAGAILLTVGLATVAGGSALIGIYVAGDDSYRDGHKGLAGGGAAMVIYGALIAFGASVPLSKAVKAKRQLNGIALGPTRLHWTGGAGFALRF